MTMVLMAAATIGGAALGAIGDANSASKARKQAEKQRAQSLAFIQDMMGQSRSDLFNLFPQAQQNRLQGMNAGIDIFKQALPQAMQAFQGGNYAAQQSLLAGLPQQQNALMGRKVDYSALQPKMLPTPQGITPPTYNPSFMLGGK